MTKRNEPKVFQMDDELVQDFIGHKYWYYLKSFTNMKRKQSKLSWNFAAFLLGIAWLAFRKMYRHAAAFGVIIAVLIGLMVFRQVHEQSPEQFWVVVVGVLLLTHLIIGFLGNHYYMYHVYRHVKVIAYTPVSREKQVKGAEQTGRTSLISSVSAILTLAVVGLMYFVVVDIVNEEWGEVQPASVDPKEQELLTSVDIVTQSTFTEGGRTIGEVFEEQFMFGEWQMNELESVIEEAVYTGTLLEQEEVHQVTIVFEVNPNTYDVAMSEVLLDGYLLTSVEARDLFSNLFKS
ncbi:DUF2628 domain-containing protein [Alkalibacillus silvisoli]|uniref:DUF2628 domain-containing protein n=1 Tax=Alkalibacillus silvisoli TaxID=392823 RepID=A0ABP3JHG1_9BACI